jgi:hypothetical protein
MECASFRLLGFKLFTATFARTTRHPGRYDGLSGRTLQYVLKMKGRCEIKSLLSLIGIM